MADDIKRIDISEFRREGYLQELNRQFLHPLGLALEVVVDDDGTERLGGVWDYRDDPEGINYGPMPEHAEEMRANVDHVMGLWRERAVARQTALGYIVQPRDRLG